MGNMSFFQNKINNSFSVAKVFAIISIVSAHVGITSPQFLAKIISTFASCGVVIFMVLAGYFFNANKYHNILKFLQRKLYTIIIPWVVTGSIVYLIRLVGGSEVTVSGWLQYILGYKTYLYFLPVLIVCYVLLYYHNKFFLYTAIVLNVISLVLTSTGYLDSVIEKLSITNYLNIFNWIGIFALGILLRYYPPDKLYKLLKNTRFIAIGLFIVVYIIICVFKVPTGYFSHIGLPFELLSLWSIFSLSTCDVFNKSVIHHISKLTFAIYLTHFLIIGLANNIYNINVITKSLSVFIVLIVNIVLIEVMLIISKKIKIEYLYKLLFGIRK